jgi:hypothetical protein
MAQPAKGSKRIEKPSQYSEKKKVLDKSIKVAERATASMGAFTANGKPSASNKKAQRKERPNFENTTKEKHRNQDVLKRVLQG